MNSTCGVRWKPPDAYVNPNGFSRFETDETDDQTDSPHSVSRIMQKFEGEDQISFVKTEIITRFPTFWYLHSTLLTEVILLPASCPWYKSWVMVESCTRKDRPLFSEMLTWSSPLCVTPYCRESSFCAAVRTHAALSSWLEYQCSDLELLCSDMTSYKGPMQ
jgi:hypothetical protein